MSQITKENKGKHLFIHPSFPPNCSEWVFEVDNDGEIIVDIIEDLGNCDDSYYKKRFIFDGKDLIKFHKELGEFISRNKIV